MLYLLRRRRDHIYACNEIQRDSYEKKFERFSQDETMSKFCDFRGEYTFISWFHDWKSRLSYSIIIECKEWLDYVDENEECISIARVIARKHMYFLLSRNNDQWFSILDAQNIFIVSKIARLSFIDKSIDSDLLCQSSYTLEKFEFNFELFDMTHNYVTIDDLSLHSRVVYRHLFQIVYN